MVNKTFNKLLLQNQKVYDLGIGVQHWGCQAYHVCSNNDPRLTLTYIDYIPVDHSTSSERDDDVPR